MKRRIEGGEGIRRLGVVNYGWWAILEMVVSTMYCTSYSTHFTYVTKVPKLLIHTYVSVTVSYSSLSVGLIGRYDPHQSSRLSSHQETQWKDRFADLNRFQEPCSLSGPYKVKSVRFRGVSWLGIRETLELHLQYIYPLTKTTNLFDPLTRREPPFPFFERLSPIFWTLRTKYPTWLRTGITNLKLYEMAQKKTIKVDYADTSTFKDGAKTSYVSYLHGWIHKSINNEQKEVYEFASPIHHWYFFFWWPLF